MKKGSCLTHMTALLLVLCLLPLAGLAGSADSSVLAYQNALQMLTSSSLTDSEKLETIRTQFEQAGSYQFGVEYLMLTDALMILQAGNANRYDDALDSIRRLSRNERFVSHYHSRLDKSGQPVLPDLESLAQYAAARKLEIYKDPEGAIALYDRYPVLDAAYRAGVLTGSINLSKYEKAAALILEGTPGSVQQAASIFMELGDYRDSLQRLLECQARIAELATPEPTLTPSPKPTLKPTVTVKPTPTPTLVPILQPPASISVSVTPEAAIIHWSTVNDAKEYKVYRSDIALGNTAPIATVTGTEYRDVTAEAGHTYLYQVASVSGTQESNLTVYAEAAIPKPTMILTPKPTLKLTQTKDDAVFVGEVTIVTNNRVNLRSGGSTDYPIVATGEPGQRFLTTGQATTGWYKILLPDNTYAYISNTLVFFYPYPTLKPTPYPTATSTPVLSGKSNFYIFPDSNRRQLTYDEVDKWQYDALSYAINELFARYGRPFIPGERFYSYFQSRIWYREDPNYPGDGKVLSNLEWDNYTLIKQVMVDKKANGTITQGKELP